MACPPWEGGDKIYNTRLKVTARFWGCGGYLKGRLYDSETGALSNKIRELVRVMYDDGETDGLWLLDDTKYVGEYKGLTMLEGGRN